MKKITLTILSFLLSFLVYSQTVIDHPTVGFAIASGVNLTKLELSDTATILSFRTRAIPGNWISIPSKTYIQDVNGKDKLYIKRTEGIPLNSRYNMPASGEVSYKLIFPAIAKTTTSINYGEANDGGSWYIYDIAVKPSSNKLRLPKELYGNWFNTFTGDWELSFNDKYAVYKNQLWSYDFPEKATKTNAIKLIAGNGKSIVLHFKAEKSGTCMFSESALDLKSYTKDLAEAEKNASVDNEPYGLPIFRMDSAIYSGYLKGYTPSVGVKTLSISLDNIIIGGQSSYVIKIAENGYFTVKLPLYYPHLCWVRSSIYNGSVFLEPGKELFHMINPSNSQNSSLYMGASARVNSDITKLMKINSFDYRGMQSAILDMSPAQYKTYCKRFEAKDLNDLDSITRATKISAKASQVMKMEIGYRAMSNMMNYDNYFEYAYRAKNKIPRDQRTLPIKTDSLTAGYFDFIRTETVNNPLAVLASSYDSFINRIKYLEILRTGNSFTINTESLATELKKSGYTFTESENLMIEKLNEVDSIQNSAEQKNYIEKYGKQITDFNLKYKDTLQSIYNTNKKIDNIIIEKYFKDHNIKRTADENKLWKAIAVHDNSDAMRKVKQFYVTYNDSTSAFHQKQKLFINELFAQKSNENRNRNLKTLFGIQTGFATDLMLAQDNCRTIVEELSPVSNEKLQTMQQQFVTPFIADYMAECNKQSIAKLEANKKKTGFVVNEVPKTEADKVFDTIMQKYKGKVVYVDFWATWCSPCRSGIERIKPLKEELAGQNIVFVYITNPSSPQGTWTNMIPDIKGEHYRVSNDEWNYLKEKFNISGIPHYALVGKNGELINPNLGHFDNQTLKRELEKYSKD